MSFRAPGSYFGVDSPIMRAGKALSPPHLFPNEVLSTTSARYYIIPFYIPRPTTFAGVKFYNSGSGDNGDKVKIAFYNQSSSGGPGTLAKNFGEATLTGAAAVRTLASSWAVSTPGWYYGEFVSDNNIQTQGASPIIQVTDVGYAPISPMSQFLNLSFDAVAIGSAATGKQQYAADYVAGTYANFPEATSLTPTNSIMANPAISGGGVASAPFFILYV